MANLESHFSLCILWVVLAIWHCVLVQHVECLCSSSESRALLDLKGNNQSDAFSSWRSGSDCCRGWAGVTCDPTAKHVVGLNLTGPLQLHGQRGFRNISQSICSLHELKIFNISFHITDGEYVQGTIPSCLWNISAMQYVSIFTWGGGKVHVNSLLSSKVCNLRNLTHLDIGGISFEGGITPNCLWGMTQLEHLNLTSVFGTESQVAPVCNLTNLTHLDLTCNLNVMAVRLEYPPPIPSCIWNMKRLESLSLSDFVQPSRISSGVCNIGGLVYLSLSDNGLYGNIPPCIWDLKGLEVLILKAGAFTSSLRASISSSICNLKYLSYLDLEVSYVHGYIPDCLWNMTRLEVLRVVPFFSIDKQTWHLSGSFSSLMCSLSQLRVLEISSTATALSGVLPACIWNMTHLQHLDLSGSDLSNMEDPIATDVFAPSLVTLSLASTNVRSALLEAIGNASALTELNLFGNNITRLPDGIQSLSGLTILYARSNQITRLPAGMSNMSQLEQLDMSDNFISHLSENLFNLSRLSYLDLSFNHLREVSMVISQDSYQLGFELIFSQNSIQKVTVSGSNVTIFTLDLSSNLIDNTQVVFNLSDSMIAGLYLDRNFIKSIPPTMLNGVNVSSLLDLSENPIENLSGLCPLKLGHGSLELGLSNLTGGSSDMSVILTSLECLTSSVSSLSLSSNNISNHLLPVIASLFQHLDSLFLSNNNLFGDNTILMGSLFRNQTLMTMLDLSNNKISGNLSWFKFPGAAPNLQYLDVSRNQLSGELPRSLLSPSLRAGFVTVLYLNVSNNQLGGLVPEPNGEVWILDLSSNYFEGPLPSFSTCRVDTLVLSKNSITGPIPAGLGRSTDLEFLDMSQNKLSGEIPAFFANMTRIGILDLSSNNFNGSLPSALGDLWGLRFLHVQNNSLHGPIPTSIGTTGSLVSLTLSHNHLEGPAPSSLRNCVRLIVLDLSHNNLSGTLPPTLQNLSFSLRVFSIASNRLTGVFPAWIVNANFTSLQVLDLSRNDFHGDLPNAYFNLVGFINATTDDNKDILFTDGIQISAKGLDGLQFTYFLTTTTSFDVSYNRFSGPIPEKLGDLLALRYLKLSENKFSGNIPFQLSNLSVLESLDLSRNSLTGEISPAFGQLDGLSYFNVSYNNLTGEIPTGRQFNTFNESYFKNNSGLCGFPLLPCPSSSPSTPTQSPQTARDDSQNHVLSHWISLTGFFIGAGTGYAAILLTLLFSKRVRSRLCVPRRRARLMYNKPYGAYKPRS